MIEVRELCASYGKVPALRDVSFNVGEHETVAVIGPNGAGKSTLLKTIVGLVRPQSGKVMLDGKDTTGFMPDQMVREQVALVPEGGRVFPNMTVIDNLRMGAFSCRANIKAGVLDEMYELFPILAKRSEPVRAHPERRRAPDACHRARAGVAAPPADAGRALPGRCAQAGG